MEKPWHYIDAWERGTATWGDAGVSWKRVRAIGPMRMTHWEASVWARTEPAAFIGRDVVVQLWMWDGVRWLLTKPSDAGGPLLGIGSAPSGAVSGFSHVQARALVNEAFKNVYGREATRNEAQFAQAVARIETNYGAAWKDAGAGSNNMGAVQSGRPPCNPATSFEYTDTHPTSAGSVPYRICFKKYPTPAAGMEGLIAVLYKQRPAVLAAAATGDIRAFSSAMYDTKYYEGFGATREARIANHVKAITGVLVGITKALDEPMPASEQRPFAGLLSFGLPRLSSVLLVAGGTWAAVYGYKVATKKKRRS